MTFSEPAGAGRQKSYWRGYGLTFRSDISLDEFLVGDEGQFDVDVIVHEPSDRSQWQLDEWVASDVLLDFPTLGAFIIRGCDVIEIYPERRYPKEALNLAIHGPVAATLLHKRGRLVMHAGALKAGPKAFLIAGDQGAGKSTTLASLVERGVPLLCDDVVAINLDDPAAPQVIAAFPQIKLCADAASRINIPGAIVQPSPSDEFEKTILRVPHSFFEESLPPQFVFLLTRATVLGLTVLAVPEAFKALMRHSYMPMRAGYTWTSAERARHFRQCAAASQKLTIVRLGVPENVDRIPELLDLILDTLQAHTEGGPAAGAIGVADSTLAR